ncbi:acyloxyacyl hydrolase|uniref:Lipid A 3-O-deacylase (PagL) n=1 Tax=Dendrosporobacter quercicolus TaxID=146817 RepID=A0A1G9YE56_9FIRM|nr:acyloxyacyl hydrolase [Dendrosporobacter quercicolus]NSL47627.1 acyloxyacyl hydrolase [Dendrosporobacter quercicolus DSM 1736]SDN07360.1 Lipid A 3-O-deacylase (PagL) [Dendrosporobacter quercicolus]
MRRFIYLIIFINFLLICLPGKSYCHAASSQIKLEWDHLRPTMRSDRNLDTMSLHLFEKFIETPNRSMYRGITITRPRGDITWKNQNKNSSAVGIGPAYMLRFGKHYSAKLSAAFDISGGLIIYNKRFPAGGEYYNFMWRIGPKFIYKINEISSLSIGYTRMHVSNGLRTNNPSYEAHGVSLGFITKF